MKMIQIKRKAARNGVRLHNIDGFITRNIYCLITAGIIVFMAMGTVFADPDALWTTISGLIETWVTRLGAVVMFIGGVMFGLGWKNDDAEQKSRGIQTLIAGAIVAAVAALTTTFFA